MGLIVFFYGSTERFRALLMEAQATPFLGRPILEEVLGDMGAAVDLGHVLDCLFVDI